MRSIRLLILACLLPLISACANLPSEPLAPQPAAAQLVSKSSVEAVTAVEITDRCRALATKVAFPKEKPGTSNLRDLRLEYRARLKLANTRLGATDACLARLVELYHQGLKP